MSLVFRPAQKREYAACAAILKEAFSGYPLFQVVIEDPTRRARFNDAVLDVWASALKRNTVLVAAEGSRLAAVAELQSPTDRGYSGLDYLSPAGLRALWRGGGRALKDFIAFSGQAGSAREALPGPKWHLCLLGVAQRGGGLGSRMLQECILPYIARRGGGVLTFNTNAEINRKFYIKNGFEEFCGTTLHFKGKQVGDWSYRMTVPPEPRQDAGTPSGVARENCHDADRTT